jgi:hypothetical protein
MSDDVIYRSKVEVTRHRGPYRTARVPGEEAEIAFGVHSAIAEHYGLEPDKIDPHATTIDYVVAAAAG